MHFLPLLAGWLVNGIVGHDLSRAMDYRGIMIDTTVSEMDEDKTFKAAEVP